MTMKSASRLGGTCSILLGVSYILLGVFHMLSPVEHRISSGPEVFLPAIASGFSYSRLVGWSLALGGIVALVAIPAIAERFRRLDEDWIRWTSNLALLGYAVTVVNHFTIFARWPLLAEAYVSGDLATRAALAAEPLLLLDPQGWLTYGAVGVFVFVVSVLALRRDVLPKPLAVIGLAASILFWLAVAGFVLANEGLISIAAGLGGVVLAPVWYIWMGLILRRDAEPVVVKDRALAASH